MIQRLKCFIPALLLTLTLAAAAWAETYQLFDGRTGKQVAEYSAILEYKLRPGDTLVFADGKSFRIGNHLGHGNTTVVFELADQPGRAIRIPIKSGLFSRDQAYTHFIASFREGAKLLKLHGVPTVGVFESFKDEYVVVERVRPELTIERFLADPGISPRLRAQMARDFVEFAKKTALFEGIGDFRPDQLVYDGPNKRWILLDWTHTHLKTAIDVEARIRESGTVFLSKMYDDGERYDFFWQYADYSEDFSGKITWKGNSPKNRWIAELASAVHEAIYNRRLEMHRSGVRSVSAPHGACAKNSLRPYLSLSY